MKSFSYRAFIDEKHDAFNLCSRELTDVNMFVNCTGLMCLDNRFTTLNEEGREDYYLMYIISGSLEFEFGERIVKGESGDFVIYPPRTKYKYAHKNDDNVAYYFIHFTGFYAKILLKTLELGTEGGIWHAGTSESVSRAFSELFVAFNSDERYKWERCGIITELILTMLAERRSRGAERSLLYKSLSYINSFYTDSISIPELAKMENISVSRYNTLFRRITGTSPTKYIMGLRINHASTLLCSTDMDIGQIGELVGYSDKHFFSRTFKAYTGKTPKEYRSMSKNYAK